jgi:cytoskeletal protein CcmA (bactofilin family)
MSFVDAIEINLDLKAFNYLIGIAKNPNINSNTFYDSVNSNFIIDNVNINSDQMVFNLNNNEANIKNIGKLNTLYNDFINDVVKFLSYPNRHLDYTFIVESGFSTNFRGRYDNFSPNNGIFDTKELLNIFKTGLFGNIQLNNITKILRDTIANNPFGNRSTSSSIYDGFYPDDLIFIPGGLSISINLPVDFFQSIYTNEKININFDNKIDTLITYLTLSPISQITRVLSGIPVILRMTDFKGDITINNKILENVLTKSIASVILDLSLEKLAIFESAQTHLRQVLTDQLVNISFNLSQTLATFDNVNASSYMYNSLSVFQSSIELVRVAEYQYNINKQIQTINKTYDTTIGLLTTLAEASLKSKYELDILAHQLATNEIISKSSNDPDIISTANENIIRIAQIFIDLQNASATSLATTNALFKLSSNTFIKNLILYNVVTDLDIDFYRSIGYLNSLEKTIDIIAGTFTDSTLYPGVYIGAAAVAVTGTITFDGQMNSNSLFVIRVGGALSTAANANMILINGALASNIFWVSVGATSLGVNTTFVGTVFSYAATTIGKGCNISGRILSLGAIALNNSRITTPITGSSINIFQLTQFSLFAVGAISNADGGRCVILGSVYSGGVVSFPTPVSSPFILIGNIYSTSPFNTGALQTTEDSFYLENYLVINYGSYGISLPPINKNNNGIFSLLMEPQGVTIDVVSGIINVSSNIYLGIYEFYILFYNDKTSTVSTFILCIIPRVLINDITDCISCRITIQDKALLDAEQILYSIISSQVNITNESNNYMNNQISITNSLPISKGIIFIESQITSLNFFLQTIQYLTFISLDIDFYRSIGYLNTLEKTIDVIGSTFTNSTLLAGVYTGVAAVAITGTITFDGQMNSNSLFVIRIVGALSTAANVNMILINGALASNIFWVSVGATSLGANTTFIGTVFSYAATSIGKGCNIYGRILSLGAISVNNSKIIVPTTTSLVDTYNLSHFSLYAGGAISNADGGLCLLFGDIGSGGVLSFPTPASSPLILIGNIYATSPLNTGAFLTTQGFIYSNNNLIYDYGTVDISLLPNDIYSKGVFYLINEPFGVTIDVETGIITIALVEIGIKEFYVIYFDYNISITSILILSII